MIATTVGPYRRDGLELVDACIASAADYVDLTGEILFAHASISRHERGPRRRRADRPQLRLRLDSIRPRRAAAARRTSGELADTTLVVAAMKGGLSGGTLASMKGQIDEATRGQGAAPGRLRPVRARRHRPAHARPAPRSSRHKQLGWIGPFVMATYNTRIVRRSHCAPRLRPGLQLPRGQPATRTRSPRVGFTAGLGALAGGLAFGPTRKLLDKVLPDPGEGPSEKARRTGFFRMEIHSAGHKATVAAKGDPGYAATAVMMGESALTLALERPRLPPHTGVLTPATALGVAADRTSARGGDDPRGRCKQRLTHC